MLRKIDVPAGISQTWIIEEKCEEETNYPSASNVFLAEDQQSAVEESRLMRDYCSLR